MSTHDAMLTNHSTGIGHALGIDKLASHKEGEDKYWQTCITQVNDSPKK